MVIESYQSPEKSNSPNETEGVNSPPFVDAESFEAFSPREALSSQVVVVHTPLAFKILQINIRGLEHNRVLLENYLANENIDVVLLSEIKISRKSTIKLRNYQLFSNFKESDTNWPSGGVAVL